MDKDEALKILKKYVKDEFYINHSLAVAAIMEKLATKLAPSDISLWYIAGLLHDLDEECSNWQIDMSKHGPKSIEILKEENFGSDILYNAILAHNPLNGKKATTNIEYALLASDPMSGFIVAITKGYPDKKIKSVKVSSILKRFKEKRYARNANRDYMMAIENTGISLEDFANISLEALKEIDYILGL